jgi:hypothetical protein
MSRDDGRVYESEPWDDSTTRYTRLNIEAWLLNWPQFFDTTQCERILRWAEVRADVLQAVEQQPDYLQDIFLLIGPEQKTFHEAGLELGIDNSTAQSRWRRLVAGVTWILRDGSMGSGDWVRPPLYPIKEPMYQGENPWPVLP